MTVMAKIDTSSWKIFNISDIFLMKNTKSIVKKDIFMDSGEIPYVTASSENNGVMTYIECPDEWMDKGNCIMIGGKTLVFSYQKNDFCSNDSHNIALYLKNTKYADGIHYLYLIVALKAALYQKYSWGDSISMKKIVNDKFYLPIDSKGGLDWNYMEEYMQNILEEVEISIENLNQTDNRKHEISISEWKNFAIGDLFEISRPIVRSQAKYVEGNVPFVASGNYNNGIVKWCMPKEDEALDFGNCITVSPLDGSAFYQKENFLGRGGAGSAILKLRNDELTELSGLFIASVIRNALTKYYYSDQLNSKTIADEIIWLPIVKNTEKPDYMYMEKYMQNMMNIAKNVIEKFESLDFSLRK